ncbi:MAG: GPI anchored serine-threonine rich family protein [Bacteroidetes bacterium]|nr:GPI anchored serine-threonine rich family protein [Bacteroidota bacterium]
MLISRFIIFLSVSVAFLSCRENIVPDFSTSPVHEEHNVSLIKITSPAYSDNWFPGTRHTIRWDVEKSISKIDILLYRKDIRIMTIAAGIENQSSYDWIVPANLNYSHHYRIKIADAVTKSTADFSDYFYIIENP